MHGKTQELLGTFDWLIATDRNSAAPYRNDLKNANVKDFTAKVRNISSVKSLTAMVVFENSLGLDMDGIEFSGNDPQYGSLGWAAKDTSKPGRERPDGKECWVLQSHPDAARELLKGKRNLTEIRELAKEVLVQDFLDSIPHLSDKEMTCPNPKVAMAIGHRWGAAFPIPSKEFQTLESQLIAKEHFVACGDYFGPLPGRIEGAYLSGRSAAKALLDHCENSSVSL